MPKGPLDPRTGLRRGRSFSAQLPISQPIALNDEGQDVGDQNSGKIANSVPTPNTSGTNVPLPRRLLPSFFYRDSEPPTAVPEVKPSVPTLPQHHKGDVAVLGYRTLDDPGMRRLEGRSDHRPVIGSYALFI